MSTSDYVALVYASFGLEVIGLDKQESHALAERYQTENPELGGLVECLLNRLE